MKVGDSVRKAIDDWSFDDLDSAMLHACNAVDGTARKLLPNLGSNARFTQFLRSNYEILGPMALPGVDLQKTRFVVAVASPKATGGRPDLADVVYGVHRCCHGHGDELPDGFELFPDSKGEPERTRFGMNPREKTLRLSDRLIFALLAVAVLTPVNVDQSIPKGYFLTYGAKVQIEISEWWGRANDFLAILRADPLIQVGIVLPEEAFTKP